MASAEATAAQQAGGGASSKQPPSSLPARRPSTEPSRSTSSSALRSLSYRARVSSQANHDGASAAQDHLLSSLDDADDVALWLNHVVKTSLADAAPDGGTRDLSRLDRQLSSLSSALGVARSDTSARIDATIQEVRSTIPRLSFDLRFVRDQAVACNGRLQDLRKQPALEALEANSMMNASSDQNTAQDTPSGSAAAALSRLSALSTLRSRMTAARDVLRLAESWSTLSSDVLSYVSESKWALAASRLSEARSSLSVFERTPEYDGRKELLASLSDDVENAIVPLVMESLVKRDMANVKKLADVFRSIGRGDRFAAHWRKSRAVALRSAWTKALQSQQLQQQPPVEPFNEAFSRLVSQLQALLDEEVLYAASLFPDDARDALAGLVEVALSELSPSVEEALDQASQRRGALALALVVKAHAAAKEAVLGLHKVLGADERASAGEVVVDPEAAAKERRLSVSLKRQSRPANLLPPSGPSPSATLEPASADLTPIRSASGHSSFPVSPAGAIDSLSSHLPRPESWEAALLSPFVRFQCGYEALETRYLAATWSEDSKGLGRRRAGTAGGTAVAPSPASLPISSLLNGDMARRLGDEVELACHLSEEAIGRTLSLTWGLGAPGVIAAIQALLTRLLADATDVLDLEARQAADDARRDAAERISSLAANNGFFGAASGANGVDGDSASSSAKEWRTFEAGVGLLRSARNAWTRVEKLEESLLQRLAPSAALISRTTATGRGTRTGAVEEAIAKVVPAKEGRSALAVAVDGGLADHERLRTTMEMIEHLGGGHRRTAASVAMSLTASNQSEPRHFTSRSLLPLIKAALLDHCRTLQRHLCDVILAPLLPYFELYASLPAWEASRLPGAVNEYDLAMPTFSLSPTETMSRVGEGMLDLPRLLEGWAEDEALVWAIGALPFAEEGGSEDGVGEAATEGGATGLARSASISSTAKRMSFHPDSTAAAALGPSSPTSERRSSHRHSHSVAAIATTEPPAKSADANADGVSLQPVQPAVPRADQVLQAHLRSISLVLLSHLSSLVLPSIQRLSPAGVAQLSADLDYLTNILSALNVDADAAGLGQWKAALGVEEQKGRRLNRESRMNNGRNLEAEDRSLIRMEEFEMVSRMRGWKAG